MTRPPLALWIVSVVGVSLFLGWLAFGFLLGHNFYVVSGTARMRRAAGAMTRFPALVCVGKGGPLETSGVYAVPLGREQDQPVAHVLCRKPGSDLSVYYTTSVYSSIKPRQLHAYVWLEHHPELEVLCGAQPDRVDVSPNAISGYRAESPTDWPCHKPLRGAVLGYAVAFAHLLSGTEQHADIELVPNGYPASRSDAR
jgi:hypothetical protein